MNNETTKQRTDRLLGMSKGELVLHAQDLTLKLEILAAAAMRCEALFDQALPKFNWGASALDANAIMLLNEVPGEVRAALKEATK